MHRSEFESMAELIADNRASFTSNTRHAEFAGSMARVMAGTNDRFDAVRFINAAMPKGYVGTRHANAWERVAYKVSEAIKADRG